MNHNDPTVRGAAHIAETIHHWELMKQARLDHARIAGNYIPEEGCPNLTEILEQVRHERKPSVYAFRRLTLSGPMTFRFTPIKFGTDEHVFTFNGMVNFHEIERTFYKVFAEGEAWAMMLDYSLKRNAVPKFAHVRKMTAASGRKAQVTNNRAAHSGAIYRGYSRD